MCQVNNGFKHYYSMIKYQNHERTEISEKIF